MVSKQKLMSKTLTEKMVVFLVRGFFVGVFLFAFLYTGSSGLLDEHFLSTGYLYEAELDRIAELQRDVTQDQVEASDSYWLDTWSSERKISDFQIFRSGRLVYDGTVQDSLIKPVSYIGFYDVTFSDGVAQVYLYEGAGSVYYHLLLAASFIAGFAAFIGVFIYEIRRTIRYIQKLRDEVSLFSQGDLSQSVTVISQDELSELAQGLDQMRLSLLEKEKKEAEMRAAQKKMVLGMSHDLKTPLTGLLAYMEILKREQKNGNVSEEYLNKAYDQILQMKTLSNRLFEYFLIDSREDVVMEEPEEAESVLGDYLSEICALLLSLGMKVDASRLIWKKGCVRVNTDYVGRIMNNLVSNLEKYADRAYPVYIMTQYEENEICIIFRNTIMTPNPYVEGSGIGTKNIAMMMKRMGGSQEIMMTKHEYVVRLYFPLT